MKNNIMKQLNGAIIFISIFFLSACSQSDLLIDNFESGTYSKWTVEGEAFGLKPANGAYPGQQDVKSFQGKYFANSFYGGDDLRGTLISDEFTIERDYINFLIGGGMGEDTYIELVVDGKSVIKSRSIFESESLNRLAWDVKAYKGQKAQIRIVDNARGSWGHILIDDIYQSNQSKSNFMVDYQVKFDAEQKYILLPIEDDGPESVIQLSVNGSKVGVPMNIHVAQTRIDYWVPIDISTYKGKNVSLTFAHVKKTDIGYSKIKQSDSFDFDYNETYRPLYHVSPAHGWMNDPNGMVYYDGEYHLFFQYNPYGSRWGNMHWGHFVSKDLINWKMLPFVLAPDSIGAIFSGSAVIDRNNTAGFGKDAMVAIYTSAGASQVQSIAYSLDKGRTFTKYNQNPVLKDINYIDFRDPKVSWHDGTKQWIMTLATGQTISFYGSKNLKEWNKLSEFGSGIGAHGGVWECPDLFPLKTSDGKTKWVLLVSINPGGPNGGSATQYFIGNFDGHNFKADNLPYPLWLDYGRDNYAGVTWSNIPESDGRCLFMGWMNNWDYANLIPQKNFRSSMTLARELKLKSNGKHLIVTNYPVKETEKLRGEKNSFETVKVDKNQTINNILKSGNSACEIDMTLEPGHSSVFAFSLTNDAGEQIDFKFDLNAETFSVDRSKSGLINFSENFASKASVSPIIKSGSYKIRLFVDKSSVECFVNDGELALTNLVFPIKIYDKLHFETDDSMLVQNLIIYQIEKQ